MDEWTKTEKPATPLTPKNSSDLRESRRSSRSPLGCPDPWTPAQRRPILPVQFPSVLHGVGHFARARSVRVRSHHRRSFNMKLTKLTLYNDCIQYCKKELKTVCAYTMLPPLHLCNGLASPADAV